MSSNYVYHDINGSTWHLRYCQYCRTGYIVSSLGYIVPGFESPAYLVSRVWVPGFETTGIRFRGTGVHRTRTGYIVPHYPYTETCFIGLRVAPMTKKSKYSINLILHNPVRLINQSTAQSLVNDSLNVRLNE